MALQNINSGATPNSLKVSAYALFLFFTAWDLATLSSNKWIHTCAVMLDCTLLLTLVVMWFSRWHHGHIAVLHIQSYIQIQSNTYKHAMVLDNGKGTRARNLNMYLHRNLPEAEQASAPEPSRTATGICIGTLRNLTWYLNQHELIQTPSCWMTLCY